jgi:PEP-CTERM motif-containing protein
MKTEEVDARVVMCFALVGDVANRGLEVTQSVPEPGILSVLALGSIFAFRRRRN